VAELLRQRSVQHGKQNSHLLRRCLVQRIREICRTFLSVSGGSTRPGR
jgi:hypothetical protein